MKRKHLRRMAAGVMTIALLGGSVACSEQPQKAGEHTVSAANGGTYDFDGIKITVPKESIKKDAKLMVTKPQPRKPDDAPFGASKNAAFDISFERNAQPADGKPLELRVPLRGELLPQGYKPSQALLYHRLPNGGGYRLMPAKLDGDVLVAKLPHLSEWQLVWLGDDEFKMLTGIGKLSPVERDGCKPEVEGKSSGKVRISKKTGWTDSSGPIRACLYLQDSEAHLSVANHTQYMLSVAASAGVKISPTSKGESEDIVRALAKIVATPQVKGFLGREGEVVAKLTANNLPATVQFRAEPNTFLAEALWFGLSLFASIVLGKSTNDVARQVKQIVEAPEVVECLRTHVSIASGKKPSFWDVFELLTSKCGETIIKALDKSELWHKAWERNFIWFSLIQEGWNAFWSFINGIRLAFTGTISVTVSAVAPACLSAKEFEQVVKADSSNYTKVIVEPAYGITCASGWAAATITAYPNLPPPMNQAVGFSAVLQWRQGAWKMVDSGQDMSGGYACRSAPQRIRSRISCK